MTCSFSVEATTDNDDEIKPTDQMLQMDLSSIKMATDNFSDANKLGQGGFGPVYKVTLSQLFLFS